MELKLKAKDLNTYLSEVFGSETTEPLLLKNLSQKTKFHLKKLGNEIMTEQKALADQAKELQNEFYQDVAKVDGDNNPILNEDGTPQFEKTVPKERIPEWEEKVNELNNLDILVNSYPFVEDDFVDSITKKVVSSTTYYNIIDTILYTTEEV